MTASFKLRSLTRESWTCPIRDSRYVSTLFAGCRCSTQNAGSFMPNRPFARPQQGLTRRGANYTHRLALSKRRRSPRRAAPTVLTDARLLSTEPSRSHSCLRGSREDRLPEPIIACPIRELDLADQDRLDQRHRFISAVLNPIPGYHLQASTVTEGTHEGDNAWIASRC
jgi:hypothetical protein